MDEVSSRLDEFESAPSKEPSKFWQNIAVGAKDYFHAFKQWRLLLYIANAEMRRNYKRTVIGPFWASLNLMIFILSMGVIFSILWHTKISVYLPYFASGYIVWVFFSTTVSSSCATFIEKEAYIKQLDFPYSFYAFSLVCRNIITFMHQIFVFLIVALVFHLQLTSNTLLVIPGLLLLIFNCAWIAIFLGIICSRFRDVQQIITSILQIAMFLTPIFWHTSQLGHSRLATIFFSLNPFYQFLVIVRRPLLGEHVQLFSWFANMFILIVGWAVTMKLLGRVHNKLVYWL